MKGENAIEHRVELWQGTLEGKRQHCRVCDKPVLGLVGQDQSVTEGIVIQAVDRSLEVDSGWYHNRCVIDAGIGSILFEWRVRSTNERRNRSFGGLFATFHDWLQEVQIFDSAGRIWNTTFTELRQAVRIGDGCLVPVKQDVNLFIVAPPSFLVIPDRSVSETVRLDELLSRLGIVDCLDHPAALESGVVELSRSLAESVLVGCLRYHFFLPVDAAQWVYT